MRLPDPEQTTMHPDEYITYEGSLPEMQVIKTSPKHNWELTFDDSQEVVFCKETAPCWFHRITQRLILGMRWERVKK